MTILEMLRGRQAELQAELAVIQKELSDVAKAIAAVDGPHGVQAVPEGEQPVHPMPVDEAIVIAVRNGSKAPMAILGYIRRKLGVYTTINSVRTRVSKLKNEGRLIHDGEGWAVPALQLAPPTLFEPATE